MGDDSIFNNMAVFVRRPCLRLWRLSSKSDCSIVKRHLFSSEILGVENFKRIRIFEKDRLSNKTDFVENLSTAFHGSKLQGRHMVADLVKLIYIADDERDVSLATALLKQLYSNEVEGPEMAEHSQRFAEEGPLSPRRFQFGPLLFRLLYVLGDLATAQSLYSDKDLQGLCGGTSCHLLLMDLLYEAGRYRQVLDTFASLQRSGVSASFPPDCTTLATASLYQLNCTESCGEMKRLVEGARSEGSALSRRCLLFAVALALRQGEASVALDIAQSLVSSNEAVFRNIKLMALAQLGQMEEVLVGMEEGGRSFRYGVLYSDTVQRLTKQFSARGDSELEVGFKRVLSSLETEGLLSPQTIQHFVIRPILRQKKPRTSQSFKTRLKSPIKMK